METEQMILIIVSVILGVQLLTNYVQSGVRHRESKLLFAYLENNEKNILKMEKDIEELNYLITMRSDP